MRRTVLSIVGALAVAAAAACGAAGDSSGQTDADLTELRQRRHALLLQFMSAQGPIRETQARALDEPGVKAAQSAFYRVLREEIIRIDPEAEALLDRARRVGAELDELAAPRLVQPGDTTRPATLDEKQRVALELGELEKALRPLQEQALADSAVGAAFAALQDSVVAAILRLDPAAQRALDRMRELDEQMAKLDREIARREGN